MPHLPEVPVDSILAAGQPVDPVSRWLLATRAQVFSLTRYTGAAFILGLVLGWIWPVPFQLPW